MNVDMKYMKQRHRKQQQQKQLKLPLCLPTRSTSLPQNALPKPGCNIRPGSLCLFLSESMTSMDATRLEAQEQAKGMSDTLAKLYYP